MSLPIVQGWMIDYRTAHSIFASLSNERIAHCVAQCQIHHFHTCHYEESWFEADNLLINAFIDDQRCTYEPDQDIYDRCPGVAANSNGKVILVGDNTAIFMTATAVAKNFGVISDRMSPRFLTAHDLCPAFGVPVFTANQYFNLL